MKKIFTGLLSLVIFSVVLFLTPKTAHADCSPALGPVNLTTSKSSMTGAVNLSWNQVTNAKRYALVYGFKDMPVMFGALTIDGGMQTNYTVTMLEPGKNYTFQIWAFCGDDQPPMMSAPISMMSS